jgi:predicted nucleotidyltransferase
VPGPGELETAAGGYSLGMCADDLFGPIAETLRKAAGTLREAEIPFLLGGSLAFWARGGQETTNDLDLMVRAQDARAAIDALVAAGMEAQQPPEDWLLKARDGNVAVDLIFRPAGLEIDDDVLARGEELEVAAVRMRVMSLEDALATKLNALGEHHLDYEPLLQTARSLREQVDWHALRERTAHSPYAAAFFTLLERLDIAPPAPEGTEVAVRPMPGDGEDDEHHALGPAPSSVR